jgi:hypothetical protein
MKIYKFHDSELNEKFYGNERVLKNAFREIIDKYDSHWKTIAENESLKLEDIKVKITKFENEDRAVMDAYVVIENEKIPLRQDSFTIIEVIK